MSNKVQLGVGDGSGQHIVEGSYETIKLLQAKLLRYEAIEAGLRRAIGVLNSIPNRKVHHEGMNTYDIIPELEKMLTYKLKDIEKLSYQEVKEKFDDFVNFKKALNIEASEDGIEIT